MIEPCPTCMGSKWHNGALCFACEDCTLASHEALKPTAADFRANLANVRPWVDESSLTDVLIGDCKKCGTTLSWDFNEGLPYLFWDETIGVYGFEDGDEQGVCDSTSSAALDAIGGNGCVTLEQLHWLCNSVGLRTILFMDRHGNGHRISVMEDGRFEILAMLKNHAPPTLRHEVTDAMNAIRPSCFEDRQLNDKARAELERIQDRALGKTSAS